MRDRDRFRLLGNYTTPRVRIGAILSCESRDCDVIVVGYSDARIPWPIGRRRGTAALGLVLFSQLIDAVRRESNQAICHWFGVTPQTVGKWRKALGVGIATPGTSKLHSHYTREPWAVAALAKAHSRVQDPERRRKIAESRRGKKRPSHVIAAMAKGRREMLHSPATRAKMSATHKTRGTRPPAAGRPWTAIEDQAVETMRPVDAAVRTGRTLSAVYDRRRLLGLPDLRPTNPGRPPKPRKGQHS